LCEHVVTLSCKSSYTAYLLH